MKKVLLTLSLAIFASASMAAALLPNGGFETNNVGGGYSYAGVVSAPDWSFAGGAGVSANYTAWGGVASGGDYFAFLQNTASISHSFSVGYAANYSLNFDLGQRTNYGAVGQQTVSVLFDGQEIWNSTPGVSWLTTNLTINNVGAGVHTLSFLGTNLNQAYDTTAFLDNVGLSPSAIPEPETYAMLLAGLGLLSAVSRRRSQTR